jgi:glycosyltransferase involved in cell wall biosynthesis
VRVLFVNGREDARQNPGGDTVQLEKTRQELERSGVAVEVRELNELDDLTGFDLAHLFNLQMPESAWRAFQTLQRRRMPIVFSPIYWDILPYWFELAVKTRGRWRWLAKLMGKDRARQSYIRWQKRKSRSNKDWQLQRLLLQHSARILPNSPSEIELLQETFLLPEAYSLKYDVIPNGIDAKLYATLPQPSQEFLDQYGVRDFVLEVGMVYPVKNQLGLIEALSDLPVTIVIIGQVMAELSQYADTCRARAAERGNVIFIDRLPHDKLPGVYALAAVHALPSWRETPGLVSLEAAASGCRIVTTSIGSTRDYFGDDAWYCNPQEYRSIRVAVESALRAPRSLALRDRVLSEYTWQRAAEATLASYLRTLDEF